MTSLRPTRKPVFLWQAGLILLPVLIIAAVASRRSSRTGRRSSARRASGPRRLRGSTARSWNALGILPDAAGLVFAAMERLPGQISGRMAREPGAQLEAEAARSPALDPQAQLAEWQAQFPGLQAEEVFPDGFGLTAEGRFRDGLEFNPAPQPPAWFTGLSPAQRAAWEALKSAAASGASVEEIEQRILQFQETSPEPEAGANAAFLGLRARLATLPPAEAVTEALRFLAPDVEPFYDGSVFGGSGGAGVTRCSGEPRDTFRGGPAAGEPGVRGGAALRPAAGPSEELWEAIRQPGAACAQPADPGFAGPTGGDCRHEHDAAGQRRAWRTLWNARLKLHDIAEAIRQTGKLRGITTTNLWIEHDQTRWLCILNPDNSSALQAARGGSTGSTNEVWTEVRFLPKSVAEQALVRALENSEVKLPAYLGLAAWLEGEPLALPDAGPRAGAPMPRRRCWPRPTAAFPAPANCRRRRAGRRLTGKSLPSRPRFVLQLYVADPALLFSSYRRHACCWPGWWPPRPSRP